MLCINLVHISVLQMTDPMAMTVLLEDGASLAGIAIAATCIGLTHATGIAMFDALGSLMIGGLLGGVALYLISTSDTLISCACYHVHILFLSSIFVFCQRLFLFHFMCNCKKRIFIHLICFHCRIQS